MFKSLYKKTKHLLIYILIRIILITFLLISRPTAFYIAKILGRFSFCLFPKDRRRIRKNLKFAYGEEKSDAELEEIAQNVMSYIAMNAVDAIRTPIINEKNIDDIVIVRGMEHIHNAYKKGKGIVAITPHLGNFQLFAGYLSLKGYPVNVIAAPLYDPMLDKVLIQYRKKHGLKNISRGFAIKEAIKCLRNGEILGVLPDQDTNVSGVFVPFFGKPAHTAIGPAALSLKTGANIMVMAIHLSPTNKHIIEIEPVLEPIRTGNKDQDILENTKMYTRLLEKYIRKYPEQWVWMHRRWRKYQKQLRKANK